MEQNEFQQDKSIDPNQLDIECVRQAEIFHKWADRSARATAVVERTKFKRDVVEAQMEIAVRKDPQAYDILKPTEGAIKAIVHVSNKYLKAYEAYLDAREESKLLDVAVATMEQKKRMLEVLITLHGQQYFAGPSVPHDLAADYQEYMEKASETVMDIQRKGTRKRRPK